MWHFRSGFIVPLLCVLALMQGYRVLGMLKGVEIIDG